MLANGIEPVAVVLHSSGAQPELDDAERRLHFKTEYLERCIKQKIEPVKFLESIDLLARQNGISVSTRDSLNGIDDRTWLAHCAPDLLLVAGGWPNLISVETLAIPKLGCINVHPSLLPDYPGTDVHRWQVLHGVPKSGCTVHYMDARFDSGNIIGQRAVHIDPTDCPQTLAAKVADVSAQYVVELMPRIQKAAPACVQSVPQPAKKTSRHLCKPWLWASREFLSIHWKDAAEHIRRFILSCTQESYKYNGPLVRLNDREFIVRRAAYPVKPADGTEVGQIIETTRQGIWVGCGDGNSVCLTQLQPASKEGFPKEPHTALPISDEELAQSGLFQAGMKFQQMDNTSIL
ncbi:MAG: hypothetical protein EA392_05265 [Cryomorphaceae bacterium]|nr:MAG: hypothetical protein EA392_05265 [Cryomorphaceae bacterium]